MADADVRVKGLDQLQRFLDELPAKVEANVLRGAMRAGMKTVLPDAQAAVHNVSGQLAAGLKLGTQSKGGKVTARLRATGKHAFAARFVEFGTRPHEIKPRRAKSLFLAGVFRELVQHPGATPRPFLRPALDARAQDAVVAAGEYMKRRLETKHGLDTADVVIEGDEA